MAEDYSGAPKPAREAGPRTETGQGDRPEDGAGQRVQKVLASLGFGSRRACEELIVEGRVRVNGARAHLGRRIDLEVDAVEVDGVPVGVRPGLVYYLLNKPAGVVTTATDPQGRPTVMGLVPDRPRVFPVGRLDADSEGLLILTNDGELAQRLSHPSFGVEKEYLAHVEGKPSPGALRRLREGVELEDGLTAPAKVAAVAPGLLRLVIHEGRNRQVRRMCAAVGHPVVRLVRTRIGPVADRRLAPARWRELSAAEVRKLAEAAQPAREAGPKTQPAREAGPKTQPAREAGPKTQPAREAGPTPAKGARRDGR
jgi:23S rRNA pseudouridine2605 synthase